MTSMCLCGPRKASYDACKRLIDGGVPGHVLGTRKKPFPRRHSTLEVNNSGE